MSNEWIPGGGIAGRKVGTPFISVPLDGWFAEDEPLAYSGGGNLIYWNMCCDRGVDAFSIGPANGPSWTYYAWSGL